MSKLANIYFLLITLLAFVPGSPKQPYFSLLTLSIMLSFLVIKDGREDRIRRRADHEINMTSANVYKYSLMGFTEAPQKELRVGDIVTVFGNEEVPADIILINCEHHSAFFDTIKLDGEATLTERFAVGANVRSDDI